MSIGVRQAMKILELLAPHPEGLRVSALAESLGVNRAIPHRHLHLLMELGYVEKDEHTDRYRATYLLGALGLRQLESTGVHEWAQRHLDDLARATTELVRLAVAVNDTLFWIGRAQGSNSGLILDPASGAEVRLHATATGKAYLSGLPGERQREVIGTGPLEAMTSQTITDVDTLLEQVASAGRRGFAIVQEEMDVGISAIAAPIVLGGETGHVEGAVSVAGPAVRLDLERLESFAPDLLDTAEALAKEWPVYKYLSRPQYD